jgi:hypothetical protein
MRRTVALAVVALAAAAGTTASAANGARAATWYWTPGLCKSNLVHAGIRIDDGRSFSVEQAFCVGTGGVKTCEWSSNHRTRLFTRFIAVVRSPDGAVRGFTLRTLSRSSFGLTGIRALGNEANASAFAAYVQSFTRAEAAKEQAKGCAPYTP